MNTEIIAILDRSGSMAMLAQEAIGGFNRFLRDQKQVPGEARMTTILFDDQYQCLYEGKHLVDAKQLTPDVYYARGMTALLDAIGKTLNDQGKRIHVDQWAEKVIVLVITDGLENASKEYSLAQVRQMIMHAEANGWSFVYLGANQDAFQVGAGLGINAQHTHNYTATAMGTQSAYATASATTRSLRSQPATSRVADQTDTSA